MSRPVFTNLEEAMSEIPFQVNEFRTYQVVRDGVFFGFIDTQSGGYNPSKGEKFQYDGTTVILHDGREFTDAPQLRSAIVEGWCTPVGSQVTTYRPKSANIQVRPTEHRGHERPVRTVIETERSEERSVVSVEGRRRSREATNANAGRNVSLESAEARSALEGTWIAGDEEIDELAQIFDDAMSQFSAPGEASEAPAEDDLRARAEADILEMLSAVDDAPVAKAPAPAPSRKPRMAVENQDARPTMPIVREDAMENAGTVVGSVADQQKIAVEREQEFALDVAAAKPPAPKSSPQPRIGGTGAVVVNEQRDMGQIALSDTKPAIKLDESASVTSRGNEMIRMGDKAQVGTRKKASVRAPETDQGVAVGRILSPAKQSFVADARNTSPDAIQRTAEGKRLKIEKYESEEVEEVEDAPKAPVATGDVQEARAGDSLEELLPDAAKPEPEVYRRPEDDPAYTAVRMLIPDFEWNKDRPVKERVADALKRVKEPMFVKGVLAVETELVREEIKKGLAALLDKKKKASKAKK